MASLSDPSRHPGNCNCDLCRTIRDNRDGKTPALNTVPIIPQSAAAEEND
jgi:hypothetical protein